MSSQLIIRVVAENASATGAEEAVAECLARLGLGESKVQDRLSKFATGMVVHPAVDQLGYAGRQKVAKARERGIPVYETAEDSPVPAKGAGTNGGGSSTMPYSGTAGAAGAVGAAAPYGPYGTAGPYDTVVGSAAPYGGGGASSTVPHGVGRPSSAASYNSWAGAASGGGSYDTSVTAGSGAATWGGAAAAQAAGHKRKAIGTPTTAAAPVEKRAARYRSSCAAGVRDRISRAMSQRMYLIERSDESASGALAHRFTVLGSTGNVYEVRIAKGPSCSCPDHGRGNVCKHILFVFLKVLKVRFDSPLIYQTALLQSELDSIFFAAPFSPGAATASASVRAAFARATGQPVKGADADAAAGASASDAAAGASASDAGEEARPIEPGDECGICFEALDDGQPLDFCRSGCRRSLHEDCLRRWIQSLRGKGQAITCVYCREKWDACNLVPAKSAGGGGATMSSNGYLNLGAVSGQSRQRDTTTYNPWFMDRSGYDGYD